MMMMPVVKMLKLLKPTQVKVQRLVNLTSARQIEQDKSAEQKSKHDYFMLEKSLYDSF